MFLVFTLPALDLALCLIVFVYFEAPSNHAFYTHYYYVYLFSICVCVYTSVKCILCGHYLTNQFNIFPSIFPVSSSPRFLVTHIFLIFNQVMWLILYTNPSKLISVQNLKMGTNIISNYLCFLTY